MLKLLVVGFLFMGFLGTVFLFNNCTARNQTQPQGQTSSSTDTGNTDTGNTDTGNQDQTQDQTQDQGQTDLPSTAKVTTYSEHIRPLIQNRCVECHQIGGIAPFALLSYNQVKSWKDIILSDLVARKMPPWGAKDDSSCQSFRHSMWLSQSEIDLFKNWVDGGTPEGTPTSNITPPPVSSHFQPSEPGVVEYSMPQSYTPPSSGGTDEYRCFTTNENTGDKMITAFDIVPGNSRTVHHVIIFLPSSERDEAVAVGKGQGYECTSGPRINSSVVAFWAPGTGITSYPMINSKQTGLKIPSGRRLVMQIHYNYAQGRSSDQTSIRFKTSPGQIKEGQWLSFGKTSGASIPAGLTNYEHIEKVQIGKALAGTPSTQSLPGYIYAIFPHMHQVGQKVKVELNRTPLYQGNNLSNECLVDVPAWDFHWQRVYWFQNPVSTNVLDSLKMTCNYNTQNASRAVYFGEGSEDEMCFLFAFVTNSVL